MAKKSNTAKLREKLGKQRTKAKKRAALRTKAYGAVSRATGLSVGTIGRNTSLSNIKRRVAYKFTAARKAALQKAQKASAAARRGKQTVTDKVSPVVSAARRSVKMGRYSGRGADPRSFRPRGPR